MTDRETLPDCGTATAALVAELLGVEFTDKDLGTVRTAGSATTFESLSKWFSSRGLEVFGVEADAESLSLLGGVCVLQVVDDSFTSGALGMHFVVAIPRGLKDPPTVLDATLPLDDQTWLNATTTLQRWTGRTLVVDRPRSRFDRETMTPTAWRIAGFAAATVLGVAGGRALSRSQPHSGGLT